MSKKWRFMASKQEVTFIQTTFKIIHRLINNPIKLTKSRLRKLRTSLPPTHLLTWCLTSIWKKWYLKKVFNTCQWLEPRDKVRSKLLELGKLADLIIKAQIFWILVVLAVLRKLCKLLGLVTQVFLQLCHNHFTTWLPSTLN